MVAVDENKDALIKSQHWLRGRVTYWPGHFHTSVFKCPTFQEMECPHHRSKFETMVSTSSSDFRVFWFKLMKGPVRNLCLETRIGMKLVQRSFVLHLRDLRLVQRFVFSNQCIPLIHFLLFPSTLLCKENEVMLGISQKPMQSLPSYPVFQQCCKKLLGALIQCINSFIVNIQSLLILLKSVLYKDFQTEFWRLLPAYYLSTFCYNDPRGKWYIYIYIHDCRVRV